MTLSRADAQKLTRRVLAAATFAEIRVSVSGGSRGNTRFAVNQPTTTGDSEDVSITVTASKGGRSATVSGNGTDDDAIRRIVGQAEALADLAPPDPEYMPPVAAQKYVRANAKDPAAARLSAVDRARSVEKAITVGRGRDLESSGFIEHSDRAFALANSKGLFAYHAATDLSLTTTCRTSDKTGSGRAGFQSHRVAGLDAGAIAQRAAEKAERSRNPTAVEPGEYTVILEPDAVAELLGFLGSALSRRAAEEGRSYFSAPSGKTRIGEPLFDSKITLWSDPSDRDHPSSPIGEDGLPRTKTVWVENGTLRALPDSRFWAHKHGREPVVGGGSFFLSGASGTVDDLIKDVKRGILVTRFWYNRMLEPRTILVTGLTRDGTFLVEDGKIVRSVKNMRYNESPITLLKNVKAMSKPERASGGRGVWVVPGMVVDGFHFASSSDAV